jgi:polyisoprenoid-binding protein YceI
MTKLFCSLALLLSAAAPLAAKTWTVDAKTSELKFTGTYQEEPFEGRFPFSAQIQFDPGNLAQAKFDVRVDVNQVDSQNEERDAALSEPDWFNFAQFPTAQFTTKSFRETPSGYLADATLKIRNVSKPIQFPFTWSVKNGVATLKAKVTLNRLDFGLGAGEWEDPEVIGHDVVVEVKLIAR